MKVNFFDESQFSKVAGTSGTEHYFPVESLEVNSKKLNQISSSVKTNSNSLMDSISVFKVNK